MGLSSFCCAKTFLPVMAGTSCPTVPYTDVVLLYANGDRITGTYDGYGRVLQEGGSTKDIMEDVLKGQARMILKKYCKPEDRFDMFEVNRSEPGQGHFHTAAALLKWHAQNGFSSYKEYHKAYRKEYR